MVNEEIGDGGQRSGMCSISGCDEYGRVLARLGGMPLIYCPRHRKYGQEVVKTFLSDIFNFKKSKLFDLAKQEMFFGGEKILDEENEKKLGSWFKKEIFQSYLRDIGSASIGLEAEEEIFEEENTALGSRVHTITGRVTIVTKNN